jgi:hypothetical protein
MARINLSVIASTKVICLSFLARIQKGLDSKFTIQQLSIHNSGLGTIRLVDYVL